MDAVPKPVPAVAPNTSDSGSADHGPPPRDAPPSPVGDVERGLPTSAADTTAPGPTPLATGAGRAAVASGRALLAELRRAMHAARDVVRVERHRGADRQTLLAARRRHLDTMLAYEQALTAARLPIPPSLRDEARLAARVLRQAGLP